LVQHFGDPAAELAAAFESCALVDRSDLGRILARGPDILDLLHRLSTADLGGLAPGEGRPTVLTSPKGRIVERLFVHHLGDAGVLLVCGRGTAGKVLDHLRRFTFREVTDLSDQSDATCQLALVGPRAAQALARLPLPEPRPFGAVAARLCASDVHVLGGEGLTGEGFSLLAPGELRAAVWNELAAAAAAVGGQRAGEQALEAYRILRGIPDSGHELTEEHNPLEAGLWDAVSFDKGCYVGQEVVARLRTYDKVARTIVGLELAPETPLAATELPLLIEGREVGRLTSAAAVPGEHRAVGLGYVKPRDVAGHLEVQVGAGGPLARLITLPFPR
jgi:folate-binding protein YgfZ